MKISDFISLNNLDKSLAFFGIFLSLILIVYLSFSQGRLVYTSIGILTLGSCILWLLIRNRATEKIYLKSNSTFLLLNIVFFLLLTCNILFVYFRTNLYERPLIFFIILSFMFGIIALEILFYEATKKNQFLIISQIIILNLISLFSQLLIFPNVVGIDSWGHQMFAHNIIDVGFIPQGYGYSNLPLMHLETASTSLITGLNYKLATAFSVTLSQIICVLLFVFLLGRFLFNNKVGLLASLLLTLGNYFIYMGIIAIPNTMAAIFIPIIIYILFKLRKNNFFIGTWIVILFMIALILTHTITSMCMTIILFVSFLVTYFFNKFYYKKNEILITINIVAFFSVAMFSWWIYVSGHINTLSDLIRMGFSEEIFVKAPNEIIRYMDSVPILEQLFNQIGMFLFFSISLIGFFFMISRSHGNLFTFNIAAVGITPLAIGFFTLIFGYFVIPERWWYFSQILLAIPISVALILLVTKIKNKSIKPIFLLFLTIFLSFIIITSPQANLDNHIFSPNSGIRLGMTTSELTAASFFSEKSLENISFDYHYITILEYYYGLKIGRIRSLDASLLNREFAYKARTIVIREEIVDRPFRMYGKPFKLNYDPKPILEMQGFSIIYDCNSVFGFYQNT